jgi:two-component system, OmpR family, sensor kinase
MSLRLRLALFGAGVVALALIVFGVLLYALLARGVATNQDDALRTRARDTASVLHGMPPAQAPVAPVDLKKTDDVFVELLTSNGSVVYTTGLLDGEPPSVPATLLADAKSRQGAYATQHGVRLYAFPYFDSGYVVAGQSTRVPQSNLSGIVVFLIVSAIPALIAALIASWLVAGRALAPLKAVANAAEDIGRTRDFGRRLPPPPAKDEVARLSSSFNGMLNQLQDAFESQRRFLADASHELRTPLTTIQGNAGLLSMHTVNEETRRAAVADVLAESGRMARLVDRLLTLARADAGLRLELAELDLRAVAETVCRQAALAHPAQKLRMTTEDARINGDEDAIRQLMWILLDNAFRYATSSVDFELRTESGWSRMTVADDGPGIPSQYRDRIFERFYRAESSRTGSHAGLGLAIAHWIVTEHRGRILAGEAAGGGASFLVDIPLLRSS